MVEAGGGEFDRFAVSFGWRRSLRQDDVFNLTSRITAASGADTSTGTPSTSSDTADGTVTYDLNDDGQGKKPWQLGGTPRCSPGDVGAVRSRWDAEPDPQPRKARPPRHRPLRGSLDARATPPASAQAPALHTMITDAAAVQRDAADRGTERCGQLSSARWIPRRARGGVRRSSAARVASTVE